MKYWVFVIGLLVLAGCQSDDAAIDAFLAEKNDTANFQESETLGTTGKTADEWKSELSFIEYYVLWQHGTEPAFTGDLLKEDRAGTYVTRGCQLPVFRSEDKYDSGTGWPSFARVIEENVVYQEDYLLGTRRIEVLSTCGEHLGHVFPDGPPPTGLRYCMNSAALDFIPD